MSEPLVSVVIPTYNREGVISQAVESALAQTYRNLEIIVVDDGSKDRTPEVLRGFGDRIRVLQQTNAGPSAARNRGISLARGEILAFLDSDDTWLPSKIARQVRLLQRLGPKVPCCLCNIRFPHQPYGRTTSFALADLHLKVEEGVWRNPTAVLLNRFVLFNQAVAVRREALAKVGSFRRDLRLLEDYELALRLSLLGPWAVIRSPLVIYGTGQPNSLSSAASRDQVAIPRTRKQILVELAASERLMNRGIRRVLRKQIRFSGYQLLAARLSAHPSALLARIGRGLGLALRWSDAFKRRTPLLTRMEVSLIEDFSPEAAPSRDRAFFVRN